DGGKAAIFGNAHPGAASDQIAPGIDLGLVSPPGRGCGRARMEFVTVGGCQQRQVGQDFPGKDDQAHGAISIKNSAWRAPWMQDASPVSFTACCNMASKLSGKPA